jgi:hypothetical protein
MVGVGPDHPRLLQQLQGIGQLRDVDPARPLSHLDAKVVTQQSEVEHVEHAFISSLNLSMSLEPEQVITKSST